MCLREALRAALRALRANRLRSGLTTLGVVIGVAAVIVGVALGNGVQAFFDELAGPLITEITVSRSIGQVAGVTESKDLRDGDAAALRDAQRAPDVRSVTPVVSGSAVLRLGPAQRKMTVLGSTADYLVVTNRKIAAGRPAQLSGGPGTREAILGPAPVQDLFQGDAEAALGRVIRLAHTNFTVVGVLTSNGLQDDVAIVPIASARASLFGNTTILNQIIVQASGPTTVAAATDEVGAILDQRHHISDPARRDFDMVSLQSLIEQREQFLDALRMFIGAVAAIALLVGGIGVANIMLVSITERTREIGVRKAVGASHAAILRQFLIESSLLAGVGGVVGVVVGIATCWAVGAVLPSLNANFPPPVVSPGSALLAFAISLLVGVVAGSYPASRAAHLRIVDALRFE